MKRSVIGTLLLAFALLVGVSALCRATKSKPPGMVVRGDFVTEAEMGAAKKAAQARSEPCAEWCGGPISYVTNNPNKIGCSEERCRELYISAPPKELFRRCEGVDCNDCNRSANAYYSVDCGETQDGCIIMLSSISGCE
jgi:hypothetical protein